MATLEVDGARLEYLENGDGEPLVMVHGSASDHRTWRFQIDAFAERFRGIAYDARGQRARLQRRSSVVPGGAPLGLTG